MRALLVVITHLLGRILGQQGKLLLLIVMILIIVVIVQLVLAFNHIPHLLIFILVLLGIDKKLFLVRLVHEQAL